jgi:CDP-paratose 2-epimerase
MKTVIVTGSTGLVGSACVKRFAREVYNIGGGRHSNCSMLEAIDLCEQISGRKLKWNYEGNNRIGDHIGWISNMRKFQCNLRRILEEIHQACLTH